MEWHCYDWEELWEMCLQKPVGLLWRTVQLLLRIDPIAFVTLQVPITLQNTSNTNQFILVMMDGYLNLTKASLTSQKIAPAVAVQFRDSWVIDCEAPMHMEIANRLQFVYRFNEEMLAVLGQDTWKVTFTVVRKTDKVKASPMPYAHECNTKTLNIRKTKTYIWQQLSYVYSPDPYINQLNAAQFRWPTPRQCIQLSAISWLY